MKITNYVSPHLTIDHFEVKPKQAWCLIGRNRSGIETLFALLSGDLAASKEVVRRPDNCGILSFSAQQALFESELKKDDTDYMDRLDPGTLAKSFIQNAHHHTALIRAFALEGKLDQGYRQLSTGQSRKLLLLSQISKGARTLLIQAPYDGLDRQACRELDNALAHCTAQGLSILITVSNPADIPSWATHLGLVENGTITRSGPRKDFPDTKDLIPESQDAHFKAQARDLSGRSGAPKPSDRANTLVCLENGSAGYQGTVVFKGVNLTVNNGRHTLISGPNGCGKSTLLQMITGDHPACYNNKLWVFGIRRGTGESIWDIKAQMGIVSADLHRNYIVPGSVLDCILSGLYDSIGLYTTPSAEDRKHAMEWLARISLEDTAATPFRKLTYADQRLVLIARALIKGPRLLILDEATQGLDRTNRYAILDFLGDVAKEKLSTILYVSHRQDEFCDFFVQHIDMGAFQAQ